MRLTVYTDYALRLLMYLALRGEALATIQEVADAYGISKNHLMKIASHLGRYGLVETVRGRSGGLRLGKPAAEIGLGDTVRLMEDDFTLVECLDPGTSRCVISRACRLRTVLSDALDAYFTVLDRHTIADLVRTPQALTRLLVHPGETQATRH